MTLDEAIKHCNEIAEAHAVLRKRYDDASGYSRSHNESIRTDDAKKHEKCSQEFKRLAEWLKELKTLKAEPYEDAISREAVWTKITNGALPLESPEQFIDRISKEVEAMPSVTPKRKTGKILTDYAIGIDKKGFERKLVNTRYCSLCKCDLGYNADILTHYCPNCGAKMENEE